jgi:hypothetical protein
LSAWVDGAGIGHDAAVAAAVLQQRCVDPQRVVEGLGAHGDVQAAPLLQNLVAAEDRGLAKAAKRALHRLKARGVEIDEPSERGTFSLDIAPDVEHDSLGYATGVDGLGGRILWILAPNASGGYGLLEAVTDDVHGIRRAEVLSTSRGDFRRHMARLRDNPAVLLAQVPATGIAHLLIAAEALNTDSATEIPAGYKQFREGTGAALFAGAVRWEPALPPLPAGEDAHRETLREAVELIGAGYFANWAVFGDAAESGAAAVRAAETSALLVDEEQRKQQIDQAVAAVGASFDGDQRARYQRRLYAMAELLVTAGDEVGATRAMVAADAFVAIEDLYADHPLARAMVQRGVMAAYQHLREKEPPETAAPAPGGGPSSPIVQP